MVNALGSYAALIAQLGNKVLEPLRVVLWGCQLVGEGQNGAY